MTRIYCECGEELTILKTVSDDLYSLKHIVGRCPNCAPDWISIDDIDNRPNNGDYILVMDKKRGLDLGEYYIYKNADGLEYEFWSYETENLSTAYFENILYWYPITVPKWLWDLISGRAMKGVK